MSQASETFEFTSRNLERCRDYLKRYPTKQAAMLPVLHLAQEQHGFISKDVEAAVAEVLEVPEVEVHKVVTFYTLFHQRPVGRHQIRLCMNLACWLRGSQRIKQHLEEKLGVASGGTTSDGNITWEAVSDCMGACEDAPMMQLDKDYYDELTPEKVDRILEKETA